MNELVLQYLICTANTDFTCCFFGEEKRRPKSISWCKLPHSVWHRWWKPGYRCLCLYTAGRDWRDLCHLTLPTQTKLHRNFLWALDSSLRKAAGHSRKFIPTTKVASSSESVSAVTLRQLWIQVIRTLMLEVPFIEEILRWRKFQHRGWITAFM